MTPSSFKYVNKIYKPPINWEETRPREQECGDLPVWTNGREIVSLWKPSLRERLSILLFGRVWLAMFSTSQPPVAVVGMKDFLQETQETPNE